jgi:hypothetical protein
MTCSIQGIREIRGMDDRLSVSIGDVVNGSRSSLGRMRPMAIRHSLRCGTELSLRSSQARYLSETQYGSTSMVAPMSIISIGRKHSLVSSCFVAQYFQPDGPYPYSLASWHNSELVCQRCFWKLSSFLSLSCILHCMLNKRCGCSISLLLADVVSWRR